MTIIKEHDYGNIFIIVIIQWTKFSSNTEYFFRNLHILVYAVIHYEK
jgi:hypothetical protein